MHYSLKPVDFACFPLFISISPIGNKLLAHYSGSSGRFPTPTLFPALHLPLLALLPLPIVPSGLLVCG